MVSLAERGVSPLARNRKFESISLQERVHCELDRDVELAVDEKALPFEPLVPNEETIEAMKAARRGELTTAGPPGKLLPSLNADC
jgi:hypothetical protein